MLVTRGANFVRNVKSIWFPSQESCDLRHTCIYGVVQSDPSGLLSARGGGPRSASLAPHSLSAAQMLPSAPMRRMPCACVFALSQSANSSGFFHTSPHRSFLAVQNNFFGWLYAIHCQWKLQPSVHMAHVQPQTRHRERACTEWAGWRWGSNPSRSHSCVASPNEPDW